MKHFRLPLIVTGVAFLIVLIMGLVLITSITQSGSGDTNKRAELLGQGLGILFGLIIAPFWFMAAYESGKARRAALKQAPAVKSAKRPTKKR